MNFFLCAQTILSQKVSFLIYVNEKVRDKRSHPPLLPLQVCKKPLCVYAMLGISHTLLQFFIVAPDIDSTTTLHKVLGGIVNGLGFQCFSNRTCQQREFGVHCNNGCQGTDILFFHCLSLLLFLFYYHFLSVLHIYALSGSGYAHALQGVPRIILGYSLHSADGCRLIINEVHRDAGGSSSLLSGQL